MRREVENCVTGAETLEHGCWGRRERGLIRQCPPPSSLLGPPWRHCRDASWDRQTAFGPGFSWGLRKARLAQGNHVAPFFPLSPFKIFLCLWCSKICYSLSRNDFICVNTGWNSKASGFYRLMSLLVLENSPANNSSNVVPVHSLLFRGLHSYVC